MTPDISGARRAGITALVAALLVAIAMCWWTWSDRPALDAGLEKARKDAGGIGGKILLRDQVAHQTTANEQLRTNLKELKAGAGFKLEPAFYEPLNQKERGKAFSDLFVNVRQRINDSAANQRIERDETLGFPDIGKKPNDADVENLLNFLQLTDKALTVVLKAPEPVEWFKISHGTKPEETGPVDRPILLKEFPLTLEVRGSLKTILWMLHQYSKHEDDKYPLILRGMTVSSDNTTARDDVQQLNATFELAGMQFLSDEERGTTDRRPAPATGGSGSGHTVGRAARP